MPATIPNPDLPELLDQKHDAHRRVLGHLGTPKRRTAVLKAVVADRHTDVWAATTLDGILLDLEKAGLAKRLPRPDTAFDVVAATFDDPDVPALPDEHAERYLLTTAPNEVVHKTAGPTGVMRPGKHADWLLGEQWYVTNKGMAALTAPPVVEAPAAGEAAEEEEDL